MVYKRGWSKFLGCVTLLLMLVLVPLVTIQAQEPTLAAEFKSIVEKPATPEPVTAVAPLPDTKEVIVFDTAEIELLQAKLNALKEKLAEAEATLAEKAVVQRPTLAPSVTLVSIVEKRPAPVIGLLRAAAVVIPVNIPRPLDNGGYYVSSAYSSGYYRRGPLYYPSYHYRWAHR